MDIKYIDINTDGILQYINMLPKWHSSKDKLNMPMRYGFIVAIYYEGIIYYWWFNDGEDVLSDTKINDNYYPCTIARTSK